KQLTTSAIPIGVPGWPEFACCTASIARVRIVLTDRSSICLPGYVIGIALAAIKLSYEPRIRDRTLLRLLRSRRFRLLLQHLSLCPQPIFQLVTLGSSPLLEQPIGPDTDLLQQFRRGPRLGR